MAGSARAAARPHLPIPQVAPLGRAPDRLARRSRRPPRPDRRGHRHARRADRPYPDVDLHLASRRMAVRLAALAGTGRAVEDELSDALHERLTQRFVDRRAAALLRRMNEKRPVHGYVDDDGAVVMEGHVVGRVEGFRFVPDRAALPAGNRGPRAAVSRVVSRELHSRVERLISDDDAAVALDAGPDSRLEGIPTRAPDAGQGRPPSRRRAVPVGARRGMDPAGPKAARALAVGSHRPRAPSTRPPDGFDGSGGG